MNRTGIIFNVFKNKAILVCCMIQFSVSLDCADLYSWRNCTFCNVY